MHKFFSILPVTIFLPIGFTYPIVAISLLTSFFSKTHQPNWRMLFKLPFSAPIFFLMGWVILQTIRTSFNGGSEFSNAIHYFLFCFVLFWVVIKDSDWRNLAVIVFLAAAIGGATIYFIAHLTNFVDHISIFKNYKIYSGNKSIVIAVFSALAACMMLERAFTATKKKIFWISLMGYVYVSTALILFGMSRTAHLVWICLSMTILIYRARTFKGGYKTIACGAIFIAGLIYFSPTIIPRFVSTFQAILDYSNGVAGAGESNRLQFYQVTQKFIFDSPIWGYGVGMWRHLYLPEALKLGFDETANMSTPHNDYLLYGVELGLIGLGALLWLYASLFKVAVKQVKDHGLHMLMAITTMAIVSMFNAGLRDWKFGIPFMIIIAITYRNGESKQLA